MLIMLQMEEIKRANNIWTSDNLFLKEFLLIPLKRSPIVEQNTSPCIVNGTPDQKVPSDKAEIVTKQDIVAAQKMSRSISEQHVPHTAAEVIECDVSANEFLSKFDCSLAKIRTSVQKLEETTQ